MRIKTKQRFGVNLGLVGLNRSQNSLREITGKVRTMPGGTVNCLTGGPAAGSETVTGKVCCRIAGSGDLSGSTVGIMTNH